MANVIGDTIVFLFFVAVAYAAIPPTVRFLVELFSTAVAEGIRKSREEK